MNQTAINCKYVNEAREIVSNNIPHKNASIAYHMCSQPFSALSITLWSVKIAVTSMYRIDHMSQGMK